DRTPGQAPDRARPAPAPPPLRGQVDAHGGPLALEVEANHPYGLSHGLDDVESSLRTAKGRLEPPLVALQGDGRGIEGRAARLLVIAPEPDPPAVIVPGGPQRHRHRRRHAHSISHVRTVSSSIST